MEKKKILVIDDDEYIRESIKEALKRKGFDLESAENGASALELFQKDGFDMVISDMKMPGMSGIELLEKIKKLDPDVPFLMITAHGAIESAVEAIKKGAYDFIQKSPNLLEELELHVERTLSYGQLLSENKRLKSVIHEQWNYVGSCAPLEQIREPCQDRRRKPLHGPYHRRVGDGQGACGPVHTLFKSAASWAFCKGKLRGAPRGPHRIRTFRP